MNRHSQKISSSDDSEDDTFEMFETSSEDKTSEASESTDEHDVSFTDMLNTPELAQKSGKFRKPAINSRAQVVTKDLFNKSSAEDKKAKFAKSKEIVPKKKSLKQKKEESWYCRACQKDRVADMRLCVMCKSYLHDECLGLTEEDKIDGYICPYCS